MFEKLLSGIQYEKKTIPGAESIKKQAYPRQIDGVSYAYEHLNFQQEQKEHG